MFTENTNNLEFNASNSSINYIMEKIIFALTRGNHVEVKKSSRICKCTKVDDLINALENTILNIPKMNYRPYEIFLPTNRIKRKWWAGLSYQDQKTIKEILEKAFAVFYETDCKMTDEEKIDRYYLGNMWRDERLRILRAMRKRGEALIAKPLIRISQSTIDFLAREEKARRKEQKKFPDITALLNPRNPDFWGIDQHRRGHY